MENVSLFESPEEDRHPVRRSGRIDVVMTEFVGAETLSWEELFQGFSKLYAITYSSGIEFVCSLLKHFEDAEIIFGFEEVLTYSLQEIIAYQTKTIERIKENASKSKLDLIARVDDGTLILRVARRQLSHEKLYLLESSDGRKRVVMGSANMSYAAFSGSQRENICYMDGDRAFDWYLGCYKQLRDSSTDSIVSRMLTVDANIADIEELPISQSVKTLKALVVEPHIDRELRDDVRFVMDVKNMAANIAPFMPKADKKGKIKLSPEIVKQTRRRLDDAVVQEKELRSESPQLVVDIYNQTVTLNDQALDIRPPAADIANDVALFIEYMNGYDKFHGEVQLMQTRYFEFANWFFTTPFMAAIRHTAALYNHARLPYPVFGLVYGQSKAGKSSFLETLLKMMIGQKPKIAAPDFTRSSIEGLKRTVKGAPIIVDDLTQTRFSQHAIETIKNDDFGVTDKLTHYPAVVISANEDVKAVSPEIIRRTVICRVQAGLKNTEVMKSSVVRRVQRGVGTAFYREYLRRMIEALPDLIEELKADEDVEAPDVLAVSSRIICLIFLEHGHEELPFYVRELTLDDYFSERVTGAHVIKAIQNAWQFNRRAFMVDKRTNQLRYNAGQVWEVDRMMKELPEDLEAHKSREWVIMDLERACEFFAINFRKGQLFSKFRG